MEVESVGTAKVPFKSVSWLQKKKEHKSIKHAKQNKSLKQICTNEMANSTRLNYLHLDAPSSVKPARRYCDITGFEAKYKDKSSGLNYADKHVFAYIKLLPRPAVDQYISLRKVNLPGKG